MRLGSEGEVLDSSRWQEGELKVDVRTSCRHIEQVLVRDADS